MLEPSACIWRNSEYHTPWVRTPFQILIFFSSLWEGVWLPVISSLDYLQTGWVQKWGMYQKVTKRLLFYRVWVVRCTSRSAGKTTLGSAAINKPARFIKMAHFDPPAIQDNPLGWGPCSVPDKFKDMPYQPFSKGDRLGKVKTLNFYFFTICYLLQALAFTKKLTVCRKGSHSDTPYWRYRFRENSPTRQRHFNSPTFENNLPTLDLKTIH